MLYAVFCWESNRNQSFHRSLRSVDTHLKSPSLKKSSGWQELLPEFESQLLEADLLNEATNSSCAVAEEVLVPTGPTTWCVSVCELLGQVAIYIAHKMDVAV